MNTSISSSKRDIVKSSRPSVTLNINRGVSGKKSRPNTIIVNTPGEVTSDYKRKVSELYTQKKYFGDRTYKQFVEDYITLRVNYSFSFCDLRSLAPVIISRLNEIRLAKIERLTVFFDNIFLNIIYTIHTKRTLERKSIYFIWNTILHNIYYIFNPIEKSNDFNRAADNIVIQNILKMFLYREKLWNNIYYSIRKYTQLQSVLIDYQVSTLEGLLNKSLQQSMDYAYVYLTTIPAVLFIQIMYHNNRQRVTLDILKEYQGQFTDFETQDDVNNYMTHISRISELPDVTLTDVLEASEQYRILCNYRSYIDPPGIYSQRPTSEPLRVPYQEYRNWNKEEFDRLAQQNENILYVTDDNDEPEVTTSINRDIPSGIMRGGINSSEIEVIELIKSMYKLITTPSGPDSGPIGEMEVKSIITDDPIWIEDDLFKGKKIVLDWMGIVMAYIVFVINKIPGENDPSFTTSIIFDINESLRWGSGADILTLEQCKRDTDDNMRGFCTEGVAFSAFMSLIMLSLTLNHSEKFLNKKARESYVILRTSMANSKSQDQTKVMSVYSGKNLNYQAHAITPETFVEAINFIYQQADEEFKFCIKTFLILRQRIISLLTENNASILADNIFTLDLGTVDDPVAKIKYLKSDYRIVLYNPSSNTNTYNKIYSIYDRIVKGIRHQPGSDISQSDFEILYETVMFQPSLRSASNNKMPTDNWNTPYTSMVVQAYREYVGGLSPYTMIGPEDSTMNANEASDINMGPIVKQFNDSHNAIISDLYANTSQQSLYKIRFGDNTTSFGFQISTPLANLQTFLDNTAVNVSYNGTFVNVSLPANGSDEQERHRKFCNLPRDNYSIVKDYVYLKFPMDMCHDACNSERTSVSIASDISKVANRAFLKLYPSGDVTYGILKSKGGKDGSSYEKECAKMFMDEYQYAKAVSNRSDGNITQSDVGLTIEASTQFSNNNAVFNFSNAVWTTKENAGNAATFIDGGTKKKLMYINLPSLCICMNDTEGNKLYVIVSYVIKEFGGIDNLTMNVSLYYVNPMETKYIFVNHEFILGKGISCHDIYDDIFKSNNFNNRPIETQVDPALPVLLYLKKTLCDWLQNFLKIQYHTSKYHRLGLFVKIRDEPTLLSIRDNTITSGTPPLIFSNYNKPIIVNTITGTSGEISSITNTDDGKIYQIGNVFNTINIYWNHFRPTYSPKHFRYFNVCCIPNAVGSSICFTNDILDFCFSVSLTFLVLIPPPPTPPGQPPAPTQTTQIVYNNCDIEGVFVDLTPAIGVMAGGSSHNNHKRKRKISYSNTKRKFRKSKTTKKNMKRKVSKRKSKQNKMKSKHTKKYHNK